MPTGATGQLGLALPVQGELSGTWGNTVNNAITEYTNIAIAATLTLTNDGAVTLANTTGTDLATNITSSLTGAGTVTAQFAIVRVTGTLTTAKVVTAPSYSKTYTVVNAATGGIVTFKASGQTGVSIAVGESAFVYFNGTDYVKVSGTSAVSSFSAGTTGLTPSTATTGAVTLAGTLAIANGGTGTTSTTFANLTTNVTGTLPIANGGTNKTSFTASQIHYGEFSTSSNFTYDGSMLSVAGSSVTSGLMLNLQNTSTGSFMQFAQPGVANLQFGCPNEDAFVWKVWSSGTLPEAMRLTPTGLGIGTSSPTTKLEVNGNVLKIYDQSTSNANLLIRNSTTGNANGFTLQQDGVNTLLYNSSNGYMAFATNNAERARISAAGGFSVGTTADPGAGAIYATGNITAYYSDARLKTVSGKIENALDKVGKLSGVYYTNNSVAKSFGYDSDEVQVGVLAQDVEAVMPEIVKAAPFDLDENNNSKSGENYKTVQYDKLVPLLIEAINELQAKVKALESK